MVEVLDRMLSCILLQQPDLDVTTQAAAKAELDRGIEKTMSFPMDGERLQQRR